MQSVWSVEKYGKSGCGGGNKQSSDDIIMVDVNKSYPKKELILQDYFDVEYIPLETTDEFLINVSIFACGKEIIVNYRLGTGQIMIFDSAPPKKKTIYSSPIFFFYTYIYYETV